MPGGPYDSSRTRVAPVFDRLRARTDEWPRQLLEVVCPTWSEDSGGGALDLRFERGYWGETERGVDPPVSLLSWLIRHPTPQLIAQDRLPERTRLAQGDPDTVAAALRLLRTSRSTSGWDLLEGRTYPDAWTETPHARLVVEGKRREPCRNVDPTRHSGRHQIWRHLDAAWEVRGRRRVFGFFLVEGGGDGTTVPSHWRRAFEEARRPEALATSFPHRSAAERDAIAACFLGGSTWQRVCHTFGIPFDTLPDRVPSAASSDGASE